jgi:hypothetical protein
VPDGTATAHLYRPKLITTFSEGYHFDNLRKDLLAALTVSIVALPLSMAFAIASGVSPERGLYTTIIGGFLVSALGGSRYQIGGPAGAFIVLDAATAAKFGVPGLLLTVLLSGVMLTFLGLSRLGSLIRHIPHAVTVGFTCCIAIVILASQLKDLGGLTLTAAEPGLLLPKLAVLAKALPTLNPAAFGIAVVVTALIFLQRRLKPNWPGMLAGCDRRVHRGMAAAFAGRNHWQPLWNFATRSAHAVLAAGYDSACAAASADGTVFHLAGRGGEPVVGQGRRQHDRPQAPFEHGTCGAGHRQYRLRPVRRH